MYNNSNIIYNTSTKPRTPAQKLNNHPPARNTNSARIWKKYSRIPYNHSETPITPTTRDINQNQPDTIPNITPQPSTPIERAGSDCPGRY